MFCGRTNEALINPFEGDPVVYAAYGVAGQHRLGFLFYTGAQSALEETKSQMMDMVAAGWREIDADDGEIEIDDDLEY